MQPQRIEGQRAQTILVVESDESTRRILDLSLRHAGFAVRVASNAEEGGRRLADRPDLVIVAADDPDGLDFCRRAKQGDALAPAVVLMLDADFDSKRRGLEAGADDFVARPIYVQEVVARSRALLQRRDRERLDKSAHDNERFVSTVVDVPLVDLLRAIAANQKSGVALVTGPEGARGELYFRQGRVVDAEVGRLSGRDAVYRLFCWSSGSLAVDWKSIRRKDTIEMAPHDLLMEALRRVDEWRRLLAGVPPLGTIFEVDYRLLAERLADIPDEVNRILRLFDSVRSFLQVIDDCGLPDLDAVAAIGKLYRERIIHDIRVPVEDEDGVSADMEGWLSDAAGPFRSPPRHERDLFGAGPDPAVGVHGRRTAPIDPLGDSAPDPLDDDMRARFTDRLQAEGAPGADASTDGIPEVPIEALMESAPNSSAITDKFPVPGNGLRPPTISTTSPGIGAAKTTEPGMGSVRSEASRPAIAIAVPSAAQVAVPEDTVPVPMLQADLAPPPPPTSPLERPYGWTSEPRSASGEILVQKLTPSRPSLVDIPRVHIREDSGKAYVRKSTATPPGSARALDEPPPIAPQPDTGPHGEVPEPPKLVAAKPSKAEESRGEKFSKADAEDELGVSSRGRKVLAVVGGAVGIIAIVGFVAMKVNSRKSALVDDHEAKPRVAAPLPTRAEPPQPTQPVIVPIGETHVEPSAPKLAPVDAIVITGKKSVAPLGTARDELDERAADPRMVRWRVAESRPLLALCRMAYEQSRMKDAEPACIAARDANPDSADAHALLAHAQFQRNKRREALASAERAVKLNPKLADQYVIIGGVRQEAGDNEEARRAYQRYLELEPKGSYAADLRAIIARLPAKL
jgi:CheY-like chemotaxis protein